MSVILVIYVRFLKYKIAGVKAPSSIPTEVER